MRALLALVVSLSIALALPTPLEAQGSTALASARAALSAYDLSAGSAPLRALGELAPIAAGGSTDATEARAMRALAGAELWAGATMLGDDAARARVAAALGVTVEDTPAHLRSELGSSARGAYRTACREATGLVDLTAAFAADGAALTAASGPRRDAAFALFVRSHATPAALAVLGPDVSDAAVSSWDERSRRALGALREALGATERARRAATAGDPLVSLLVARLAEVADAVTGVELRPSVDVPAAIGLPTLEGGAVLPFDALVLVAEREVHLGRSPIVRVGPTGAILHGIPGDVLPAMRTIAIAAELPSVPQSLDDVVAAASALGLSPGAVVVMAPTGAVPAHVMTRVLLSLSRASVTVTHLGAERADETLTAIPFRAARAAEAGVPDVHTRVRLGGYAVARGERGRDTTLPRVRDASGALAFDEAGLSTFLLAGAHATVTLEAMATVEGADVVRTAFLVAESGAAVTWLLP